MLSSIGNMIASAVGARNVRFEADAFLIEYKPQPTKPEVDGDETSKRDLEALQKMFGL
jgi:hypothetical protein